MWAAEPPRLFSTCASGNALPCAGPVSRTRRAANGGGCSSGTDSGIGSAPRASGDSASSGGARGTANSASAATRALSMVASSYVSTGRSASTWIEGGGVATAFFVKGVPQSKQNFAAGGFRARQFAHGFSGGSGTESTGSNGVVEREEGGGAGGGRRVGIGPP